MKKFLFLALFFLTYSGSGFAAVYKLGASGGNPIPINMNGQGRGNIEIKSCLDNDNCSNDEECVSLRCEKICRPDSCPNGKICTSAGDENPHQIKCVECRINRECKQGMYCDNDNKCKEVNPCLYAVCSPAAPFCTPKPYKTLPYTCVQCLENEHCPPVGGLTRSCVDGFCLFNVKGNIPSSQRESVPGQQKKAHKEKTVSSHVPDRQKDSVRETGKKNPPVEKDPLQNEDAFFEDDVAGIDFNVDMKESGGEEGVIIYE